MANKGMGDARARGALPPMEGGIGRMRLVVLVAYGVMLALLTAGAVFNTAAIRDARDTLLGAQAAYERAASPSAAGEAGAPRNGEALPGDETLWLAEQAYRSRIDEAASALDQAQRAGTGLAALGFGVSLVIGLGVYRRFGQLSRTLRADLGSLRRLAHEDALTGLLNRPALLDAIDTRLRRGQPFALLYIDLDGFKEINDLHGHTVGDRMLRMAASRIRGRMRAEDTVARIGGDEFIAMVDNIASAPDCEVAARHLLEVFERPFQAGTVRATIGASIGAAIAPASGSSAGDLLNAADRAMYRAKHVGGNAFRLAPVVTDTPRPKASTR